MSELSISIIKSFHYLMTPIGLFFCLCIVAIACAIIKFPRLARTTLYLAIFTIWFFATPKTSHWFYDITLKPNNMASCKNINDCSHDTLDYDAIIVAGWMGAFNPNDPRIDSFWSERLWQAAQLHRAGIQIIINSSQYPTPTPPSSNELTYAEIKLLSWGIPQSDIAISEAGRTTQEAMLNAFKELVERQHHSTLLIGYPYRLPRKYLSLKRISYDQQYPINITVIKASQSNDTLSKPNNWKETLNQWTPNEQTLIQSRHILHEAAGLLAYKLGNWI